MGTHQETNAGATARAHDPGPEPSSRSGRRRVIAEGDPSVLNMTPMIDMTFLLVVFFMLTIDLTTKEFVPVALPFAHQGVEDVPPGPDAVPRIVVNLDAGGVVTFQGQTYGLSTEHGLAQTRALAALTAALRQRTADPRYRDDQAASEMPILIHADRDTKWQYVQWILQCCSDVDVKLYKLQFAVKQPAREEAKPRKEVK